MVFWRAIRFHNRKMNKKNINDMKKLFEDFSFTDFDNEEFQKSIEPYNKSVTSDNGQQMAGSSFGPSTNNKGQPGWTHMTYPDFDMASDPFVQSVLDHQHIFEQYELEYLDKRCPDDVLSGYGVGDYHDIMDEIDEKIFREIFEDMEDKFTNDNSYLYDIIHKTVPFEESEYHHMDWTNRGTTTGNNDDDMKPAGMYEDLKTIGMFEKETDQVRKLINDDE